MTRRPGEWIVAAFALAFVVFVAISFRPGHRPKEGAARATEALPDPPASSEAGQPTTVLKKFDYTESLRGKTLFHIQSDRTVGYGPAAGLLPNLYALEKVTLTVYPETGAPVTVHSDRATYDQRTSEAHLSGNVRWIDGRGALGETAQIEFAPTGRRLVAPGAIRLTRGTFVLNAKSGVYDVPAREAKLEGPIQGVGTGEGTGGLSSLSANGATYKRDENLVELTGGVSGSSTAGNRLEADRLVLKTEGENNRLDWARADGHVRGRIVAAALPLAAGTAAGGARPPQEYSGERAGLLFAADGSVRSLSLSGSPARVDDPTRRLRAETIEVGFENGRARTARAERAVHVESADGTADAAHANMALTAAGETESLDLSGSVRMTGQGRTGNADRAVQVVERGVWILTGTPGRSATVEGEGSKVSAARIELDQKHKGLRAEGGVRATMTPREGERPAATPVGDGTKPTFGKADRMTVDDATRVATLSGSASLWQGTSSVFGNDITLNDAERTLVAVGNTRTVFATPPPPATEAKARRTEPADRDRHPSVVTARRLVYREDRPAAAGAVPAPTPAPTAALTPGAGGPGPVKAGPGSSPATAVFDGGVVVTSAQWRATAAQATATIARDRQLEKVILTGDVALQDAKDGRNGKADRATDWPREGRTLLEGAPAVVVDRDGNRVSGASLTIHKRGGSVEVTAPEGGRTETIHKTSGS